MISFIGYLYSYRRPDKVKITFFLVATVICLIICFGYMTGSDWRAYEEIYESYNESNNFYWRFLYVEPGYLILNIIGNVLGLNFWVWYEIIRLLLYFKVCHIFLVYSPRQTLLLGFTFYLGFFGIMHFMDPSFRNMIAAFVFLCGFKFVLKRQLLKFLLITLLAVSFHYSAIFILFVYWIAPKKVSTLNIVLLFIVANIVLTVKDPIMNLLSIAFSSIEPLALKIANYSSGEEAETTGAGKIFSLGYLIHCILFILLLLSRKRIEVQTNGPIIFNLAILFVFLFRLGLTILIFSRLYIYIYYFYAIGIGIVCNAVVPKQRLLYSCFVLLLALLSNTIQMRSYKFIPYSNILWYIDNPPSYEYRDMYNRVNSPYKPVK